jgi:predicted kinase
LLTYINTNRQGHLGAVDEIVRSLIKVADATPPRAGVLIEDGTRKMKEKEGGVNVKQLQKMANECDQYGMYVEADWLDGLLHSYAANLELIILRGISGSGKSTLANELSGGDPSKVFSTDEYFMENQEYTFDPSKLAQAHQWNQNRVQEAMEQKITPIIVDNTNTQRWEARPYVQMAVEHGYDVKAEETTTPWRMDPEELARRNIHGVPREAIERMVERYEPHDVFTQEEILKSKAPWEK